MGNIFYATVEQVMRSLEIVDTARNRALVKQKLAAGTDQVEGLLNKRFYPEFATKKFDWPNYQYNYSWQLFLDSNEIISVTSLVAGGVTIPPTDYVLRRDDNINVPPFNWIEIKLNSGSALASGPTFQQAIEVTGKWNSADTATTLVHADLAAGVDDTATLLTLNPHQGTYPLGIGGLFLLDDEYMALTDRRMVDTGDTLQAAMADLVSAETLAVPDGNAYALDEVVLIGAERMRVADIAGNNLIVERSFDGSTLAAHAQNDAIYAQRAFVVERGVCGTTAAAHTLGTGGYMHEPPGLVNELCTAETVVLLEQNRSAYARTVGTGPTTKESGGKGLEAIRDMAVTAYGRKCRMGAI